MSTKKWRQLCEGLHKHIPPGVVGFDTVLEVVSDSMIVCLTAYTGRSKLLSGYESMSRLKAT